MWTLLAWQDPDMRPKASRKLFNMCSKSTPDWLMDGRLSDYVDFFHSLKKIQRESCLWLGCKHQHKLFRMSFHHVCLNNYKYSSDLIFSRPNTFLFGLLCIFWCLQFHLIALGCTQFHIVALGCTWLRLASLGCTWFQLVPLGCTWFSLVTLGCN